MPFPQLIVFGIDIVKFIIDLANFYALYLIISLTLNLEFGYTGIPNFGKVLYIAGGAAIAGSLSGRLSAYLLGVSARGDFITFNAQIITEIDNILVNEPIFVIGLLALSLLIAALIGAIFGYLSSYPAIRLREDYLGMLLLAVAQFFQVFLRVYDPLVGGTQGIFVPDPYFYWASLGAGYRDFVASIVMISFAIVTYLYIARVTKSPLGRTLKAIRDSEDTARAVGKDDTSFKRRVLIVASAICGMAGALVTFYSGSVGADTWTRFAWTFWPWLIVIIGGAGNNLGVMLGTLFFAIVSKSLEQAKAALQSYLPVDPNWVQYLVFASILILVLFLRPEGILKERPTPTIPKWKLIAIATNSNTGSGSINSSQEGGVTKATNRASLLLRLMINRLKSALKPR